MIFLCIGLITAASLTGCTAVDLQSKWRNKPIILDGSVTGWPKSMQYFDKDSRILLSIVNDADNLYIRLVTRSETSKRLFLGSGFTVWIDANGGTGQRFGIQFPLARQGRRQSSMPDHKPRTGMEDKLADSQHNLAILRGSDGSRQTMPVRQAEESGIYTSLTMHQSILVYELKVPLPSASANKIIGIKFESGKPNRPSGNGASRGGKRGGRGGHGGGGGGGGKGKGGRGGGSQVQAINIQARVYLAEQPGS